MPSLPEVTAGSEEGFVDLNFLAERSAVDSHGTTIVEAIGQHQGVEVGFTAQIGGAWTEQKIEDGFTVHWGKVRVSPRGNLSHRMVRMLDELYEVRSGATHMVDTGELTAVALSGNPLDLHGAPVKMKLFLFEDGPDDQYCEVFLNVDLNSMRVEFHEKDPDYRRPLIVALSADAG